MLGKRQQEGPYVLSYSRGMQGGYACVAPSKKMTSSAGCLSNSSTRHCLLALKLNGPSSFAAFARGNFSDVW